MDKPGDEQSVATQDVNKHASESGNSSNSSTENQDQLSKEVESNNQITTSSTNNTSAESPAPPAAAPTPAATSDDLIRIRFMPIGNAPLMKVTKFNVSRKKKMLYFIEFLSKKLFKPPASNTSTGAPAATMAATQSASNERIFIYCNNTFSPTPDQSVGDLYQSFKIGDELIISYSLSEAYG